MSTKLSPLDNLHIASPCHASWDAMTGDDQTRFCKSCSKNVFNLSMMTRAQAENLIREKEGKLCVQYAQRADGTIITQDCPVGLEKAKHVALRPWRSFVAGVAGILAALYGVVGIKTSFAQPPLDPPARQNIAKGDLGAGRNVPTQVWSLGTSNFKRHFLNPVDIDNQPKPAPILLKDLMDKPQASVRVLRGEPVACPPPPKSEPKLFKMGKPVTSSPNISTQQGGAVPSLPKSTAPHVNLIQGKITAPVVMGEAVAMKPSCSKPVVTKPLVKKPAKPAKAAKPARKP